MGKVPIWEQWLMVAAEVLLSPVVVLFWYGSFMAIVLP